MKNLTRRDLLKTSLLAPAAAAAARDAVTYGNNPVNANEAEATVPVLVGDASDVAEPGAGRERLLLDFGWRFYFGHADDPARDFGFGGGRSQFPEDRKFPSRRRPGV